MVNWTLNNEHREQIPAWNKKWIDIIRRTEPMTEEDRHMLIPAIRGMYNAAGLDGDNVRVVVVASPMMAAAVAGAAAWWWDHTKNIPTTISDDGVYYVVTAETREKTHREVSTATVKSADYVITDETTNDTEHAIVGAVNEAINIATFNAIRKITYNLTDTAIQVPAAAQKTNLDPAMYSTNIAAGVSMAAETAAATSLTVTFATADATARPVHDASHRSLCTNAIDDATIAKTAVATGRATFSNIGGEVYKATTPAIHYEAWSSTATAVVATVTAATSNVYTETIRRTFSSLPVSTDDDMPANEITGILDNKTETFSIPFETVTAFDPALYSAMLASDDVYAATELATSDAVFEAIDDAVYDTNIIFQFNNASEFYSYVRDAAGNATFRDIRESTAILVSNAVYAATDDAVYVALSKDIKTNTEPGAEIKHIVQAISKAIAVPVIDATEDATDTRILDNTVAATYNPVMVNTRISTLAATCDAVDYATRVRHLSNACTLINTTTFTNISAASSHASENSIVYMAAYNMTRFAVAGATRVIDRLISDAISHTMQDTIEDAGDNAQSEKNNIRQLSHARTSINTTTFDDAATALADGAENRIVFATVHDMTIAAVVDATQDITSWATSVTASAGDADFENLSETVVMINGATYSRTHDSVLREATSFTHGAAARAETYIVINNTAFLGVFAPTDRAVFIASPGRFGNDVYDSNVRKEINKYIRESWRMRSGGNMWAAGCCFLSFVRDVIGWKHKSHDNYKHYELAAIHGGPRYMHEKFCVVSDFPTELHAYEENGRMVAHNDSGPALAWSDGWSIWMLDGVQVDEQIVMRPETQTLKQIENESNEEIKRIRIERYGWTRYIAETDAECIDSRINEIDNTMEALVLLGDESKRLLCSCRSTGRVYAIGVSRNVETCEQAQAFLQGGGRFSANMRVIGAS